MTQIHKSMFPPGSLGRALCEQREATGRNPDLHPLFQQILEPMTTKATPPIRREVFWIHVEDHMPDDETTVLVWNSLDVWFAWHEEGEWRECGTAALITGVTHWMDAPEGPEEAA